MKHRRAIGYVIAALPLGAGLVACGGGSTSTGGGPAIIVYYGGTVTTSGALSGATNQPALATLGANGAFNVTWWGGNGGSVSASGGTATVVESGATEQGAVTQMNGSGAFSFQVTASGQPIASGSFTLQNYPSLGTQTTIPPAGNYGGQFVVISNGQVVEMGTASGTVGANGQVTITTNSSGLYVNGGSFSGTLQSGGIVANGAFESDGAVYVESSTNAFSWNGNSLVLAFPSLALQPATAWITLNQLLTTSKGGVRAAASH